MVISTAIAFSLLLHTSPKPVFQFDLQGELHAPKKDSKFVLQPGTSVVAVPKGFGLMFTGDRPGVMLGDPKSLQFTKSFSIAVWMKLDNYVTRGPSAKIFFRGDDRNGYDPYTLEIRTDHKVYFTIENKHNENDNDSVGYAVPLNKWVHVLATYEYKRGIMKLYVNGVQMAIKETGVDPFGELMQQYTPGIGIGNVQNNKGPHNEPFSGKLADLRIYDQVITPSDLQLDLGGWYEAGASGTQDIQNNGVTPPRR